MSVKDYLNQNYHNLKSHHLRSNTLFSDQTFPANDRSISLIKSKLQERGYKVYWKRPFEIVNNPRFIVNDIDPNDLNQGENGNCWFISAMASIVTVPNFRDFVIPSDQSFDRNNYAGIFHFRFWQFGQWYDVVIDDLLPVNEDNELIFCNNEREPNEFWGPLMEKAYAKLASCYEFLDGGLAQDAFTDMTGAIGETIDITKCLDYDDNGDDDEDADDDDDYDDDDDGQYYEEDDYDYPEQQDNEFDNNGHIQYLSDLWKYMVFSHRMQSLLNTSFNKNDDDDLDEDDTLPNGLVPNHAYSLYQVVEVKFGKRGDRVRLIKLRNPHGTKKSWKGAYSINNKKWINLSPAIKQRYNLSLSPNGEFYMTFEDFVDNFEEVNILHVNLNAFLTINPGASAIAPQLNAQWRSIQLYDEWRSGLNAGVDDRSYWQNCQFLIEINARNDLTSIIIGLMQPYSAQLRFENNAEMSYVAINFDVYSVVCSPNKIRDYKASRRRFNENDLELVDSSGEHSNVREVTKKCFLKSGYYVILPSTDYHKSIQYLLRLFYDMQSVNSIEKLTN